MKQLIITPSFEADSDTMTAVKIVQTFIHEKTGQTAVGMRVAYRHKVKVTKEMIVDDANTVPDSQSNTSQWKNLQEMALTPLVPKYQATVAENSTKCLQQFGTDITKDGEISVCDPDYVNLIAPPPRQVIKILRGLEVLVTRGPVFKSVSRRKQSDGHSLLSTCRRASVAGASSPG